MGLLDAASQNAGTGEMGSFLQGLSRGARAGWDPADQDNYNKMQMQNGYQQAAQAGGIDGAMEFLQKNDPAKALDLQNKKQDLNNSYLQAANLKAQNQMQQMQLQQANSEFAGKAYDVILRQPEDRREDVYQKMLPLIKQHDSGAPDSFDADRAMTAVQMASEPDKPTELMKNTEYLKGLKQSGDELGYQTAMDYKKSGGTNINLSTVEGADLAIKKGLINNDLESLKGYSKDADGAQGVLNVANTGLQLLQGSTTGIGTAQKNQLLRGMQAAGVPINEADLAKRDVLESYMNQFTLTNLKQMQGLGALSEIEGKRVEMAGPGLQKTPEGNKMIMEIAKTAAMRQIGKSEFMRTYLEKNQSLSGSQEAWTNYVEARPLVQFDETGAPRGINEKNAKRDAWKGFLNPSYTGSFSPEQEEMVKGMSDSQIGDMLNEAKKQNSLPTEELNRRINDVEALKGYIINPKRMDPEDSATGLSQYQGQKTSALKVDNKLRGAFASLTPKANPTIIDGIVKNLPVMGEYGINTPKRQAAFIGQLAHESAGFKTMREYASGKAYEGRKSLGNTEPGDGQRFKGRGLIQLTGRANYANYGKKLGIDLVNNPELAETPEVAMRVAAAFWDDHGLNELADRGDIRGITKRINGGQNGLADRARYTRKATQILASLSVEDQMGGAQMDGRKLSMADQEPTGLAGGAEVRNAPAEAAPPPAMVAPYKSGYPGQRPNPYDNTGISNLAANSNKNSYLSRMLGGQA